DAALRIDVHVVEVEQVPARVRSAAGPDAAQLHRIARRRVDRGPGVSAVIRRRDVEVPGAAESGLRRVSRGGGADESDRSAARVAGGCDDEVRVLDAERRADVEGRAPGLRAVVRDRHPGLVWVAVEPDEVERAGAV